MAFFGNIIYGVARLVGTALNIYVFVVIGSAIISWVNPDPYNVIVRFLRSVTEPIYVYIRRYIPFVFIGGFDLSPIVLILAIQFAQFAVVDNLRLLAGMLSR